MPTDTNILLEEAKCFACNTNASLADLLKLAYLDRISTSGGGGGSQTPWTSDIDGGGFDLTNVDNIEVNTGSESAPSLAITGDANTGLWAPGADTLALSVGGAEIARFDSTGISLGKGAARSLLITRSTTGAGATLTIAAQGALAGATNSAGGNLILRPGLSTGNANSQIEFQVSSGSNGSADATYFTVAKVVRGGGIGGFGIGTGALAGASTAGEALDVSWGRSAPSLMIGADSGLTTRTNATNKVGRIGICPYNTAAKPVALFHTTLFSSSSALIFGGGTSVMQAATSVQFYTGTAIEQDTGVERLSLSVTETVFNQTGTDTNFRVESTGDDNLIFGDAGVNNVGIGTGSPAASAKLEIVSTTMGFLPPRMTTVQKNAIGTPSVGLVVFDTDLGKLAVYTGAWEAVTSA